MEKIIFIIGAKHYSKELLSRCLEKYSKATCYHFFSKQEALLYLGLNPALIICDENDFLPNRKEVKYMKAKTGHLPVVYTVLDDFICLNRIKEVGLKTAKKLRYKNLYSSLTSLVIRAQGTRRASALLMY